eukprot:TRINITY_DN94156_c0_g1_i1.p1 TRINITY_DN94156_c0_g1~~TRINITY_DN94156_c0_g1_i1.p1  ORF type:complete len:144 (-),score=24.89 TRINITY_DN94156_c0_g1_i1:76-507(-)
MLSKGKDEYYPLSFDCIDLPYDVTSLSSLEDGKFLVCTLVDYTMWVYSLQPTNQALVFLHLFKRANEARTGLTCVGGKGDKLVVCEDAPIPYIFRFVEGEEIGVPHPPVPHYNQQENKEKEKERRESKTTNAHHRPSVAVSAQ